MMHGRVRPGGIRALGHTANPCWSSSTRGISCTVCTCWVLCKRGRAPMRGEQGQGAQRMWGFVSYPGISRSRCRPRASPGVRTHPARQPPRTLQDSSLSSLPFPPVLRPPLRLWPFGRQHPSVAVPCLSEIKPSGLVYFGSFAVNSGWSVEGGVWQAAITRFFPRETSPPRAGPSPAQGKVSGNGGRVDAAPSQCGTAGHECNEAAPFGSESLYSNSINCCGEGGGHYSSSLPFPLAEPCFRSSAGFHGKPSLKTSQSNLPRYKQARRGVRNRQN